MWGGMAQEKDVAGEGQLSALGLLPIANKILKAFYLFFH